MAYQNVYDILLCQKHSLNWLSSGYRGLRQRKTDPVGSDLKLIRACLLQSQQRKVWIEGVFAPYPAKTDFYPWRKQEYVTETTDFISQQAVAPVPIRGVCWPLRRRIRICRSTTWSMLWLLPTVSVIPHG